MLRERFADPVIFAIFGPDDNDKTVSGGIVGVKEVGDNFEEPETAGKDDEEIFGAKEMV